MIAFVPLSDTERPIFRVLAHGLIPVKITRYTNDITQITAPNRFECSFQFSQDLSQQKLTTLDKLHEGPEDNITVKCKVLKRFKCYYC